MANDKLKTLLDIDFNKITPGQAILQIQRLEKKADYYSRIQELLSDFESEDPEAFKMMQKNMDAGWISNPNDITEFFSDKWEYIRKTSERLMRIAQRT
jgi:hypothetical protein